MFKYFLIISIKNKMWIDINEINYIKSIKYLKNNQCFEDYLTQFQYYDEKDIFITL